MTSENLLSLTDRLRGLRTDQGRYRRDFIKELRLLILTDVMTTAARHFLLTG